MSSLLNPSKSNSLYGTPPIGAESQSLLHTEEGVELAGCANLPLPSQFIFKDLNYISS